MDLIVVILQKKFHRPIIIIEDFNYRLFFTHSMSGLMT